MFRLYSKGCGYAIRGLMHFPPKGDQRVGIQDVCRLARIPEHFARKMFQTLVQKGILQAVPGPGGGYRFRRPPEEISILNIIQAIDGEDSLWACVLGFPACDQRHPCALHPAWLKTKRRLLPGLGSLTLADLMKDGFLDGARRQRRGLSKRS